jgi:hypothetical protein
MRVRFKREHEGYGQGLVTDVDDEKGKAAVEAGAAEEMHRVRLTRDFRHGGQTFAANFDYDLTADQVKAAHKAGAVPEAKAEGAGEADADEAAHHTRRRRAQAEKAEG